MMAGEAKMAVPDCWTQAACGDAERSSPGYGGASLGLKSCPARWRQVAAVGGGAERLGFGEKWGDVNNGFDARRLIDDGIRKITWPIASHNLADTSTRHSARMGFRWSRVWVCQSFRWRRFIRWRSR
ncbi:hypothetical protein Droror1_Dr00020233 [Drosera rotundifolia]